ncbi:hypothetical protein TorRG33x02_270080 [Trema orientale]|uniref:Uncharacterized protein n=1 Tax=Trema orientale TaxID=63057 RepID=A0A2P5CX87_TREOI|nr:hypothetical protein TorRG33x02_270080 [Trema orientale]
MVALREGEILKRNGYSYWHWHHDGGSGVVLLLCSYATAIGGQGCWQEKKTECFAYVSVLSLLST